MKVDKELKKQNNHKFIWRLFFVVLILLVVCGIGYFLLKFTGLWEYVNSIEKIQSLVEKGGIFSALVFIILQILQTTILQIPSIIVTAAGAIIFGQWTAFLLSFLSIIIGSIIMFWIGRKFGRKFLHWLAGQESSERWIDRMSHGKYLFFLMMLFPLFPDDILCVVAGTTNMSFNFFLWTNILARGVGIATTVFFAGGDVIPFSGWGLVVWVIIAMIVIFLFYISIRYQDKIDEYLGATFNKKK
ncbi:MAG: TVP38/TMEM64 family protein [Clostridia bacterium]